jgi:hypothetical protein
MWKNVVETNIMVSFAVDDHEVINFLFPRKVGTHADSLIAEAVLKNISGFDRELAWEAVWKGVTTPPEKDLEVV